MHKWTVRM